MSPFSERLLYPDAWFIVAAGLGIAGGPCVIAGILLEIQLLITIGLWLFAPLLILGSLLVVVVIPIIVIYDRWHKPR